ncbi:hypothetical protein [Xanthobacter sp. KR7-225]|uniref:hypothetical protein n=1 Tax=Xanthobacter sp. KR7-225 TaxID=3156613 RepID=UPI0032B561AE
MKWGNGVKAAALSLSALLVSCGDTEDARRFAFEKFITNNRVGSAPDYWLVKYNALSQYERVALVFGFMEDFAFCQEVAELYMRKYPMDHYSCEKAN